MLGASLKPDEAAPVTGRYGLFEPDGRFTGIAQTFNKDDRLPPVPMPGMVYRLVDAGNQRGLGFWEE